MRGDFCCLFSRDPTVTEPRQAISLKKNKNDLVRPKPARCRLELRVVKESAFVQKFVCGISEQIKLIRDCFRAEKQQNHFLKKHSKVSL